MCHCETSDRSHWLWQSVTPVLSAPLPKGGWHGEAETGGFVLSPHRADRVVRPYKEFRRGRWSCCGAQNFCAALRRTLEILTAATRSLRFLCHWQRSVRSPHRPAPPHSLQCVIAQALGASPYLTPKSRYPCFSPPDPSESDPGSRQRAAWSAHRFSCPCRPPPRR